jgi:hypothetical protein
LISELNITNCTKGLEVEYSKVEKLQNSIFLNLGSSSIAEGGAFYALDINMTLDNVTFNSNTAD